MAYFVLFRNCQINWKQILNISHQIRLYNSAHLCKNWNAHIPFTGFIYQLSEYFIGQRSKEEDSEEWQNSATT